MEDLYCHSETFTGVYFVLFRFDTITENKVRTKLENGGGVDIGKYSQNCTHVIVDKLVYDDEVCIAAREDGKKVVTALWVDHSFDVGLQLDPNSIMYRPPRDLNGIPGAKDLVFCLTGYQRQDRDDIMTMVGLLGAQFSKPLVANKVTHLICYKFEGEKFELAKKMRKIKLINHRWLEDCLRDWILLPEENYSKSAYELEMMEAEAKDSEDEAEKPTVQPSEGRISSMNPSNFNTDNVNKDIASAHAAVAVAMIPEDAVVATSGNVSGVHAATIGSGEKGNCMTETSGCAGERNNLDSKFNSLSYSRKTPNRFTLPRCSDERSGKESVPLKIPSSKTCNDDLETVCYDMEMVQGQKESGCVDGFGKVADRIFEESTSILPQRKTGEVSCANFKPEKPNLNEQSRGKSPSSYVKTPVSTSRRAGTMRRLSVGNSSCTLDENAQLSYAKGSGTRLAINGHALSPVKSKEPLFPNVVTSVAMDVDKRAEPQNYGLNEKNSEVSPTSHGKTRGLLPTSYRAETNRRNSNFSSGEKAKLIIAKDSNTLIAQNAIAPLALKAQEPLFSNDVTSEALQSDNASTTPHTSLQIPSESDIGGKRKIADISTQQIDNRAEPSNRNQDAQCLSNKKAELKGFSELACANLRTEGSGKALTKRTGKKSVPKKTLGSKRTLSAKGNQKSSVYSHKITSVDAAAASHLDKCELAPDNDKPCSFDKLFSSPQTNAVELVPRSFNEVGENVNARNETVDDETEAPEDRVEFETEKEDVKKTEVVPLSKTPDPVAGDGMQFYDVIKSGKSIHKVEDKNGVDVVMSDAVRNINDHDEPLVSEDAMPMAEQQEAICGTNREQLDSCVREAPANKKGNKGRKRPLAKTKMQTAPSAMGSLKSKETSKKESSKGDTEDKSEVAVCNLEGKSDSHAMQIKNPENSSELEKENQPVIDTNRNKCQRKVKKRGVNSTSLLTENDIEHKNNGLTASMTAEVERMKSEPMCFILSGHRLQRKEFQLAIRRLKGRCCRDSHQWSYQATHFISPDPPRRTEKLFAAAASGRWILKTDFLTASSQAGKFLAEDPYEWHRKGLSEDGAINMEAPRKWRILRQRTGHGALHGMRVIIYGDCIAPPLDTLKRVVKAGGGTILATSPPYSRFLPTGVDYAIVSPGMPRVDLWVQQFLKHEIPCIVADYLVEYVCKPGFSLERHILYGTHTWAERSYSSMQKRAEEIADDLISPDDRDNSDIPCQICGSRDRGDVMLICGDESGTVGCGIGTHMDCCDPPFEHVPVEDWFCATCSKTKNCCNPSRKKRKGVS